ncbi:MAG: ATP-binding cassette domain-containing protein, partial [Planctomycetes bacterium]|nr:ATP-binding cassette domain-containing protein [Planctomycetota bacterium]
PPPTIIRELTTTIMRGEKVGIIGPNGCGKTTLIRLLLGELSPQAGKVRLGTNLDVAYFDQLRATIDDNKTVAENVSPDSDKLTINGQQKHILGYLEDFLFAPDRSRSPARFLSGGERNRLLLARLFSKPSNILVLDEPTNDLDAETLELLENLLVEYSGTVLLVSHDRAFLNEVVTQTLVFEGNGIVKEYAGGYDDWVRQRNSRNLETEDGGAETGKKKAQNDQAPVGVSDTSTSPSNKVSRPRRMSFKEQKELEQLPIQIEELETEQQQLNEAMSSPNFFQQDKGTISKVTQRIEAIQQELADAFERWETLESLRN